MMTAMNVCVIALYCFVILKLWRDGELDVGGCAPQRGKTHAVNCFIVFEF